MALAMTREEQGLAMTTLGARRLPRLLAQARNDKIIESTVATGLKSKPLAITKPFRNPRLPRPLTEPRNDSSQKGGLSPIVIARNPHSERCGNL